MPPVKLAEILCNQVKKHSWVWNFPNLAQHFISNFIEIWKFPKKIFPHFPRPRCHRLPSNDNIEFAFQSTHSTLPSSSLIMLHCVKLFRCRFPVLVLPQSQHRRVCARLRMQFINMWKIYICAKLSQHRSGLNCLTLICLLRLLNPRANPYEMWEKVFVSSSAKYVKSETYIFQRRAVRVYERIGGDPQPTKQTVNGAWRKKHKAFALVQS